MRTVEVRLYGPLNDFLPPDRRQGPLRYALFGTPSVKDVLEALGVPHPEIALVVVNGEPAGFGYRLQGGERVAAYPAFASIPIEGAASVAPAPQTEPRFLLDGHLATLAASLRLFGFDAELPVGADDATLARRSREEDRILLTRDLGLLKRSEVTRGAFVRATDPRAQELEVVERFGLLEKMALFTRCSLCNVPLAEADPAHVEAQVPAGVRERVERFRECPRCGRIYWDGSHPARIRERLDALRSAMQSGRMRP